MKNISSCPNCRNSIKGTKIYKCRACKKEYCKKCSGDSKAITHTACTSTGTYSGLPTTVGIVGETTTSHSSSYSTASEQKGCWQRSKKGCMWVFFILLAIFIFLLLISD